MNISALDIASQEKLDKYLFKALDPAAMPAEYASALNGNDFRRAMQIAVDYFRKRPSPAFFDDLKERPYDKETAVRAAKGDITVVNLSYAFPGGEIDYLYDPTKSTGIYNPEWQWQINRMYFWNDMALAYLRDRDEKLAAAFDRQAYKWVTTLPCPAADWNGRAFPSAWRTIETGIRLMNSWQTAFEVFRKSPSVRTETLALMLASMHEQALHALANRTRKNWLMIELSGVHTFGVLFPEFKISSEMRKQSAFHLGTELKNQLLPDNMHYELSPDYHWVILNCCVTIYANAMKSDSLADLPADFGISLEKTAEAFLQLTTPGFTQPRTNDCYTINAPEVFKKIYPLFPHRKDFLWAVKAGKEGEPPAGSSASRFLPWGGFVAMRSSWKQDAAYLCFDVGALGMGHMHQDKLNINIYKGKEELLFDDGGGNYENSPYRHYAISAAGHNTVLVDGAGQFRQEPKITSQAIDAQFFTGSKFDYACGVYDDTFGENCLKPATHKREILFVKPDFFAVADTLQSVDGNLHDYTMLMQLETLQVKTAPGIVHGVLDGEYDLYALLLSDDISVVVESGKSDPVSGWYVGRNDKIRKAASTVKVTAKQQKDFKFLTLFFPLKKGDAFPQAKKISQQKWEIRFNGSVYLLDLSDLTANFKSL